MTFHKPQTPQRPAPPVLYSFRRCPYAMRARLALAATKTPVELREVVLRDKPAKMLDASPKGTVPVLVLTDGTVIDESLDIMRWALAGDDPQGWWPDEPALREDIDALIAANDGPFKSALDRYKYPDRYTVEMADPEDQRDRASVFIDDYESRLSKAPWLIGNQMTLADAAILPFVRQFAHVDRAWFDAQPWPNVIAWLDRFLGSALFASIMDKHPAWQPGQSPVPFPAVASAGL